MNNSRKRLFQRFLAIALIIALFLPSINAGAVISGSNSSANGGKGHTGVFNVHAPGVILTLQLVQNKTTEADKKEIVVKQDSKAKTANGSYYDEQGVTVVDQYLAKMPNFMTTANLANNSALVVRTSNSKMAEAKKAEQALVDANAGTPVNFAGKYYVDRYAGGSAFSLDLLRSKIWNDKKLKQAFIDKKLSINEVSKYIKKNKSTLDSAAEKFAKYFSNTGNTSVYLNGMLKCDSTKEEDIAVEVRLRYL